MKKTNLHGLAKAVILAAAAAATCIPITVSAYMSNEYDGSQEIAGGEYLIVETQENTAEATRFKGKANGDIVYKMTPVPPASGKQITAVASQWYSGNDGTKDVHNLVFEMEFMFPEAGSQAGLMITPSTASDYYYNWNTLILSANDGVYVQNPITDGEPFFLEGDEIYNDNRATKIGDIPLNVWHKVRLAYNITAGEMTVRVDNGDEKTFTFNPDGLLETYGGGAKKAEVIVSAANGWAQMPAYVDNIKLHASREHYGEDDKAAVLDALGDYYYEGNVSGVFKYAGNQITGFRTGAQIPDPGAFTIPAVLEDGTVISQIGEGAFQSNTEIRSLKISEGISSIANYAFQWCSNLSSVEFPETLVWCAGASFYASGVEEILLNGNTALGQSAFGRCAKLAKIVAPKGIAVTETSPDPFTYAAADTTPQNGVAVFTDINTANWIKGLTGGKWANWDFYGAYINEAGGTACSFRDGAILYTADYDGNGVLENVTYQAMDKGVEYTLEDCDKVFVWDGNMNPLVPAGSIKKKLMFS